MRREEEKKKKGKEGEKEGASSPNNLTCSISRLRQRYEPPDFAGSATGEGKRKREGKGEREGKKGGGGKKRAVSAAIVATSHLCFLSRRRAPGRHRSTVTKGEGKGKEERRGSA